MLEHIASRDNVKVKFACKVAALASFRDHHGLVFAEGRRLCFDLAETLHGRTAFVTQAFLKQNPGAETLADEVFVISEPVDDKLSGTKTPQGVYCLFEAPKTGLDAIDFAKGTLICEAMQDPANVGAVVRSAAAFGYGGVVLLRGSADPFGPKALRAAMGAVGRIALAVGMAPEEGIAAAKAAGATVVAAALGENALPIGEANPARPVALLVGTEGEGLTPAALALADQTVYIPMHNGMQSLNAAAAASVFMYHFAAGKGL